MIERAGPRTPGIGRWMGFLLESDVGFADASTTLTLMRIFRRLFLVFCIIATGALVWGAVYARKEGFTPSWRAAIEREFAHRGYYIEIGKLTLGAFRGLVAEDVKFYQDASRKQEVAVLDDVFLDVDLSKIFDQKQISINTLDVQDASLSLPLDQESDGKRFRVEDLSGRIVITESVIEIVKAEATMAGFDVVVKGSLIRPPTDQVPDSEDEAKMKSAAMDERREQITAVLTRLEEFKFLDDKSKIEVEFRGDLNDMSTISAEAEIKTGQFRRKGNRYTIESISAGMVFDGPSDSARIEELVLSDRHGEALVTGAWSKDKQQVDFSIESSADLPSLVGLFSQDKRLGEIVFFSPPEIKASGHIDLAMIADDVPGFPGEMIGDLHVDRFGTRGTVFAGLDAGYSVAGESFYLRNLRLDHKTGVAFLNLKYEPGQEDAVRYQMEIKLDPMVFRPFFGERGRDLLDAWDFGDTSTVYLAGVGEGADWDVSQWKNKGVIDLRNFRLNGVPFLELEAEVETENNALWFRDVALKREEGTIVAELAKNDFQTKQWKVKGVVSTVDLIEGARAFSPQLAGALVKFRTSNPPTIRLSGSLDARRKDEVGEETRKNVVEIAFETEGVTEFDFMGKTLSLLAPAGELHVDGSRVHLTSMNAGIFGGRLNLDYDSKNVRAKAKPFVASVRIQGVPLEKVTKLYGDHESITGSVAADFDLSGIQGNIASLNGKGSAGISEGYLFSLPILGPLSKLIEKSGESGDVGNNIVHEATATFQIKDGILHTDDIAAKSTNLRVRSAGAISLIDGSLDLEAVANTHGVLAGVILTPVSELLTYSCSGTLKNPEWKPKHISNLGKIPTTIVSGVASVPIEGLKLIRKGIFGNQEEEKEGAMPEKAEEKVKAEGAAAGEPKGKGLLQKILN